MQQRCAVAGRRSLGGRVTAFVACLATLVVTALVGSAAPAAARGAPRVTGTDLLVVWDGTRETAAVRWRFDSPVTRVSWLVATPTRARTTTLAAGTLGQVADVARPRDRWLVTHPWLLFSDDGARARDNLASALAPTGTTVSGVRTGRLSGQAAVLAAARAAGLEDDAATRDWARDVRRLGWTVQVVTVTTSTPSTVVGPVAIDFATSTPLVPSTAWPTATGAVTLLTVAPRVLAPAQPDLALPTADDLAGATDAAGTADAAAESLTGPAPSGNARSSVPTFTVDNARTLPASLPALEGRTVPARGWVVTALSGRDLGTAPTVLLPQGGPIKDWRTQVGVWWPGWGSAALAVLVVVVLAGLGTVVARRRARRPAAPPSDVPPPLLPAAPPARVDTLTDLPVVGTATLDLTAADAPDPVVDTRPDIHPVR